MAGQLEVILQTSYDGGINAVTNPLMIGNKQVWRSSNLLLDEHASLRTVDGSKILTTAPDSEWGRRLLMPLTWLPVNGELQTLIITQPANGQSRLWNWATTPWTLIGEFNGNHDTPTVGILNNIMVFADGYNTPKQWDGVTFQDLLDSAEASGVYGTSGPYKVGGLYVCNHESFLYFWNTSAITYQYDGPSSLRQSDLNNPNSWSNAQQLFIAKDDGQQGRGMCSFTMAEAGIAPTDTLVLFKDRSTYMMFGNLGTGGAGEPSSNFSVQQVKSDMGCYAVRSIQFCSGFGIIRLTHRGFALFDGVDDRLISEEIRPYLFGRDDIPAIDWSVVFYSWASQSHNPPLYICFCPTAGSGMTRGFVYDLIRKAWSVIDLPFTIASIALIDLTAGPPPGPPAPPVDVTPPADVTPPDYNPWATGSGDQGAGAEGGSMGGDSGDTGGGMGSGGGDE